MRVALAVVLCALAVLPAPADTVREARTFEWLPGRLLALDVTVGDVRVEGSDRNDVEVTIQRTAPTAEGLAALPLEITETPGRVAIRLVQADGRSDPALRAEVVVRMPSTALVEQVRVMEGRLQVERFRGTLTADLRRGPIEGTDVSGTLRLETVIGSITLRNARLDPGGLLRLRAFNGDVRVHMAGAPSDARILALALNGSIRSDIPLTTRDTWGPRWSEATLGKGEPLISIDVVTGSVEILTKSE
ncbi:MAG: hypothetical protein OEW19_11285 [Acidobacteriota bacterium]|nr:hypothetical protein [Acidobacteriota bacterium]